MQSFPLTSLLKVLLLEFWNYSCKQKLVQTFWTLYLASTTLQVKLVSIPGLTTACKKKSLNHSHEDISVIKAQGATI